MGLTKYYGVFLTFILNVANFPQIIHNIVMDLNNVMLSTRSKPNSSKWGTCQGQLSSTWAYQTPFQNISVFKRVWPPFNPKTNMSLVGFYKTPNLHDRHESALNIFDILQSVSM